MNNSKFPNYIYKTIIKILIEHSYKYKQSLKEYKNLLNYNNEVIQLSLVSKKWFELVSISLKEILKFKNIKLLSNLIDYKNIKNKNKIINYPLNINNNDNHNNKIINYPLNINNNNNQPSLLRIHQYNNDKKSKHINNKNNNMQSIYKKVLLVSKNHQDSMDIIKSIKNYPPNYLFNIRVSSNGPAFLVNQFGKLNEFLLLNINNDNDNDEELETENNLKLNVTTTIDSIVKEKTTTTMETTGKLLLNRINKIKFCGNYCGSDSFDPTEVLKKLSELNPKRLEFYSFMEKPITRLPFEVFNLKSLKSLKINDSSILEPSCLSKIDNQTTKLKKLTTYLPFNLYVEAFNSRDENYIKEYGWGQLFEKLSNNRTIKKLHIKYVFLSSRLYLDYMNAKCIDPFKQNTNKLNQYFSLIFDDNNNNNNNNNNSGSGSSGCIIETLIIDKWYFINSILYNSLSLNKSIKNLKLFDQFVEPFFEFVLPINKTIRNLYLKNPILGKKNLFDIFKNYFNIILNLYSISIVFIITKATSTFSQLEIIEKQIDLIKNYYLSLSQSETSHLKEINFLIDYKGFDLENNKKIINFTKVYNIIISTVPINFFKIKKIQFD
ncbi:hypothetical protein ACTFIW_011732 [Dictyostelium discoideum]